MSFYGSEEHEPVTWVRGYPLFAAHLVAAVFVITMIVTAVIGSDAALGSMLMFTSADVLAGEVWRVLTYGLWNPPSLRFAIDMVMLVWFGREVERILGRAKFLLMYAGIYLIPPLLFTLLGRLFPNAIAGQPGSLAIFVAFATLHPNAPIFFTLLAKWVALILVGLFTLIALGQRNWQMLISLWATTGFAYAYIRHQQGAFSLPQFSFPRPRRKPQLRVLPDLPAKKTVSAPVTAPAPSASMAEVDALLDKIAQHGIGSLTAKERAKLDAARRELKKRE